MKIISTLSILFMSTVITAPLSLAYHDGSSPPPEGANIPTPEDTSTMLWIIGGSLAFGIIIIVIAIIFSGRKHS